MTNEGCCVFTGISLRAETQLQLPGSFSVPEEIPPSPGHPSGETLQESMSRLDKGLISGTLLMQFEVSIYMHVHVCMHVFVLGMSAWSMRASWLMILACLFWYSQKLYRKKAGQIMSCAKLSENMEKNRYKDVLPCKFLLTMSKKMTFVFSWQAKLCEYRTNSEKAIITIIMACYFFPRCVSSQCFSYCYGIIIFFLFSMSERVFEYEPECFHCFVIMIEPCYDYRCKSLRCEWIRVIVKCTILFYCM